MTIEDFLRLTLRNIVVLLVSILVCVGAAFGYYKLQTPIYAAKALGYVSVSAGNDEQGNPVALASGNQTLQMDKASTYVSLFKTRAVGQGIVDRLKLEGASPDAIAAGLTAWVDSNAPVIFVSAKNADPRLASDIANAAVESAAAEARRLDTGGREGAQPVTVLVPYEEALAPGAPIEPVLSKYLLVGFGVGIFLGYLIAFLRFRADTRVRTVEDVEKKLETPVFAVLPESKALQREKGGELPEPNSFTEREALRKLRTNLRFLDIDNPPRVIVVTSAIPAEGKSTVSGNLARVLARSGQKTLLIDADLRRPVVHTEFDVDGSVGLTQLLTGRVALDDVVQKSSVRNLQFPPDSLALRVRVDPQHVEFVLFQPDKTDRGHSLVGTSLPLLPRSGLRRARPEREKKARGGKPRLREALAQVGQAQFPLLGVMRESGHVERIQQFQIGFSPAFTQVQANRAGGSGIFIAKGQARLCRIGAHHQEFPVCYPPLLRHESRAFRQRAVCPGPSLRRLGMGCGQQFCSRAAPPLGGSYRALNRAVGQQAGIADKSLSRVFCVRVFCARAFCVHFGLRQ
ncbi:YveK family protein [Dermabacteraceae bacterium P13101]